MTSQRVQFLISYVKCETENHHHPGCIRSMPIVSVPMVAFQTQSEKGLVKWPQSDRKLGCAFNCTQTVWVLHLVLFLARFGETDFLTC